MDFSLTEDQQAAEDLAATIFGDLSTHERLKEIEATEERFDERLWSQLAGAGLLGLSLPELYGGAGRGFIESCVLAESCGRFAAAVPLVETLVLGAAPIAEFGSETLRQRWLPGVVAGDIVLSAALEEPGGDPFEPTTTANHDGSGWRLSGTKTCVPAGMLARAFVVPARSEDRAVELFVVASDADGVSRTRQVPTSGRPEALLELDGVVVDADGRLSEPGRLSGTVGGGDQVGRAKLLWLLERAQAAMCIQEGGACKAAVDLTARYTSERRQFGKPIAEFQAVGQRAADAYVDAEAVRLTAWQAAWRLDAGLPASAQVAVAKFWGDDGAQRVVLACQHLHGGVGVDRDYPLHRYFLLVKQLALALGGTQASLVRLGGILAGEAEQAPEAART